MDYKKRMEEVKKAVSKKAQEIDDRYGVTHKVEQAGASAADAIERARSTAARHIQSIREEYEQIDDTYGFSDRARQTSADFTQRVERAAQAAEDKIGEVLGSAEKHYRRAEQATHMADKTAGAAETIAEAVQRARSWVNENPEKLAVVSLSLLMGSRAGAAWSGIEAVVLGAGGSGHWLFHSSLAPYGLQKASEKYFEYLKRQELLVAAGLKNDAEANRIHFQRRFAKYVGAPLVGAFSLTAGSALIIQSVSGVGIAGAPVSWILGTNPLSTSVWLFANGVVCIQSGYKVLMLAFTDDASTAELWERMKSMKALPTSAAS